MRISSLLLLAYFPPAVCTSVAAQQTTRVSLDWQQSQIAQASYSPQISADGRWIAFSSAADGIVPTDSNGSWDLFVRDSQSGTVERISVGMSGQDSDGDSWLPKLSPDARFVAFSSYATNLVVGDTNGKQDVFVRNRVLGTTERASISTAGAEANDSSFSPSISADGRVMAFVSFATNLGGSGSGGFRRLFVHDMGTGATTLIDTGGPALGEPSSPAVSDNGRFVVYVLGSGSWASSINLFDRQTGSTTLVSVGTGGPANSACDGPSISSDGRFVAFGSYASNLVAGDTDFIDVFVRDVQQATTLRVSVGPGGVQGNGDCSLSWTAISSDGRFLAFQSRSSNLVPGDTNGVPGYSGIPPQVGSDVFLRDLLLQSTERINLDTTGNEATYGSDSAPASISADGRLVAFGSPASNLVASDTNGVPDVFVRDRGVPPPFPYCTAKVNSLGCVPVIGAVGLPSTSGPDNFQVTASNVLNLKSGMMLWGNSQANAPFHGGTLCIAPPIVRTPIQNSGGTTSGSDCSGSYSYHFSQAYMSAQFLSPGSAVCCQYWNRDPGFPPPDNIGLTDGLQFVIGP